MAGHHDHHHHHHHHHQPAVEQINRSFIWGIVLNLAFVLVETAAGFWSNALSLLTDAGHNLGDVGALALSLFAFRLARKKPTERYSYGYRKTTIMASVVNGLILLIAIGAIGIEAVQRLWSPREVPGLSIALVAGIGIAINSFTAWLFFHDREKDLNIRGAYLHLAADAAVSAGVVIGGVVLHFTGWTWLDPVISFLILGVILWSTWKLLRDSLRLTLDAVPEHIDVKAVERAALDIDGIQEIHHIHIWAMSTTETALTAHLVLNENAGAEKQTSIKKTFRHALEHLGINHATLEFECAGEHCDAAQC